MSGGPITVTLVDDHPATLLGVETWLRGADPPITVVASGPSIRTAWCAPGDRADVVVLDLRLDHERIPSFENLKRLVSHERKVVVYSMHDEAGVAVTCLDLGASTFLTKAEGPEHLVPAIAAVVADRPYLPPSLSGSLAAHRHDSHPKLSEREIEVLTAWFQCDSKQLVAKRLNIKPASVSTYLDRIRIKYAATGRPAASKAALVARALQDGLIDLDFL